VLEGRQNRSEPGVVGHATSGQGNVEVGPEEDPLSLEIQLLDAQLGHMKCAGPPRGKARPKTLSFDYSHLAM